MSELKTGDSVVVRKCEVCPKVVGKTAKVKAVVAEGAVLSFGRGRPQLGRPSVFRVADLSLVDG